MTRLVWLIRVAAREAHAELGSFWLALWVALLIAIIPIATFTGLRWDAGLKSALLAVAISYPITFTFLASRKAIEYHREGHPYLRTQIDIREGGFSIWLMLKDGAPPQAVNDLGVVVRRRGDRGHAIRLVGVAGTRTIDHSGPLPPHVIYPDYFPGASAVEPGVWQIIWSDMPAGKRREFLFHEQQITIPLGEEG